MFSIQIDGTEIGNIIKVTNVDRGGLAPITTEYRQYSAIDGSKLINKKYTHRTITIEYSIYDEVNTKWELIKKILTKNEVFKVVFGDYPDRYFECILDGDTTFEKHSKGFASGTISLVAPHPFAYSVGESTAVRDGNKLIFDNQGTSKGYPVIEFVAERDYMMIGFSAPHDMYAQFGYSSNTVPVIKVGQRFSYDSKTNKAFVDSKRLYLSEGRGLVIGPNRKAEGGLTFPDSINQVVTGKLRSEYI